MKQLKLFLLGILFYVPCTAQIQDFRHYQEQINKAELLLIDGKKGESLATYLSTFKAIKGNFCKDVFNAIVLADELHSKDTLFELLPYLLPKGLKNDYFSRIDFLQKYYGDSRWKSFAEKNAQYQCPNPILRARIDSLDSKDQEFRVKAGSYKVYGDTIKKIDSLNMQFLLSLVSQNQFPGEDEIGVQNLMGSQNYDVVLTHYTQMTSMDTNRHKPKITGMIVNLVLQGKLLPNKAAHWLESQNSDFTAGVSDVMNFIVNGKETGYYRAKISYEKSILVSEYRKWLCLEPLEDYFKKFKFVIQNPKTNYRMDISRMTLDIGPDEKVFIGLTQNMELLK